MRSKPRKQPAVMVVPEREMPGQVATACATPTSRTSSMVAFRSVLRPFRTRSLAYSRQPVNSSAAPTNSRLSDRPSMVSLMGRMANSGSVPTMISRISRRAGGTGAGVVPWIRSPTPRKNSTIISRISPQ